MADKKDINSTERLLNVIRGAQRPSDDATNVVQKSPSKQKKSVKHSVSIPGLFSGKRRVCVGVDVGRDVISFAKMTKSADGRPLLLDHKILALEEGVDKNTAAFRDLLRESLTAFAGPLDRCDIWTMMNAAEVNVQHLKIPIVARKELENVIYWTARKENPIDEKNMIFDYEMQGEVNDQGIPKYRVMAYNAPRAQVEHVREMFSSIGISPAGITIAPFAVQNIFRTGWIRVAETAFATLYVGNDFSRIDIFSKNNLAMTRGIKTGIGSMMEAVSEYLAEFFPGIAISPGRIKKILQEIADDPRKVIETEGGIAWSEEKIGEMIAPALERLTRQIERTLEYYTASVGYEKVEKVYISSVMNMFCRPLKRYIGEQLATVSDMFNPFAGKDAPDETKSLGIAERASLVPAIGLALSHRNHTPNALFTYVEKNKEAFVKRIDRGIFAAFAVALAVCLAVGIFQVIATTHLSAKHKTLEQELSRYAPVLSKDKVAAMAKDLKLRHQADRQYAKRYKGMALIGELSFLTPDHVRLTGLRIALPVAGSKAPPKDAPKKETEESVVIEGVVLGESGALDALLAQYVMKLENSPMLRNVTVQKSSAVTFKKKEIVQFTINAKIG